jgi:hypothetical protein
LTATNKANNNQLATDVDAKVLKNNIKIQNLTRKSQSLKVFNSKKNKRSLRRSCPTHTVPESLLGSSRQRATSSLRLLNCYLIKTKKKGKGSRFHLITKKYLRININSSSSSHCPQLYRYLRKKWTPLRSGILIRRSLGGARTPFRGIAAMIVSRIITKSS